MSLRTNSRMPASTSVAAATPPSASVSPVFSERMTLIGLSPLSGLGAHTPAPRSFSVIIRRSEFDHNAASLRHGWMIPRLCRGSALDLPASLEACADALAGCALRGLADRSGDADAVEQFLLGADLAQPFLVGRRHGLAHADTGAGVEHAQFRRLVGRVIPGRARAIAGDRDDALLRDIVTVLQ